MNPVQISCTGMDAGELKREFGDRFTFWGGGCDTRFVLSHGTPAEIRQHVAATGFDPRAGRRLRFSASTQHSGRRAAGERHRHVRRGQPMIWTIYGDGGGIRK